MEVWGGERIEPTNPKTKDTDSKQNGEVQLPPAVPQMESGGRFQTNGDLQTNPSSLPNVEPRDRVQGWVFCWGYCRLKG